MTRTEALAELVRLKGENDPEYVQPRATNILLQLLNDDEITEAFESVRQVDA